MPRYFPRPVPESCAFCIGGFGKTPLLVWGLAVEAEPVVMPGVLLDLVALAPVLAPVMSLFEGAGNATGRQPHRRRSLDVVAFDLGLCRHLTWRPRSWLNRNWKSQPKCAN